MSKNSRSVVDYMPSARLHPPLRGAITLRTIDTTIRESLDKIRFQIDFVEKLLGPHPSRDCNVADSINDELKMTGEEIEQLRGFINLLVRTRVRVTKEHEKKHNP